MKSSFFNGRNFHGQFESINLYTRTDSLIYWEIRLESMNFESREIFIQEQY